VHSKALFSILRHPGLRNSCLTTLGARAMFWYGIMYLLTRVHVLTYSRQDLFAALIFNSERDKSLAVLEKVLWRRQVQPRTPSILPKGFIKHQDLLPRELLCCIEDIVELQTTIQEMKKSSIDRTKISNMLADVESRLASEAQSCQDSGSVAECCRIAAFITCFLSFTETWANALIPCRLSDLLQKRLSESIENPIWSKRRNLQLWCILTGACVTFLNTGYLEGLEQDWINLSFGLRTHFLQHPEEEFDASDFDSALKDFIYSNCLLQQRMTVIAWSSLELGLLIE
jgi:hypothetical protein